MHWENVSWIDVLLLGVILLSTGYGLFRGLIRSIFGIVSLVLAFLIAKRYGAALVQPITVLLGETPIAIALSHVIIFVIATLLFGAFTYLVRKAATKSNLGGLDMYGGLLFGALRGGLLAMIFVVMLSALPIQNTEAWESSAMLPPIGKTIQFSLKQEVFKNYRNYWHFDEKGRPNVRLPTGKLRLPDYSDSSQALQARDDLLDNLIEEATSQSLHNEEISKKNALLIQKKINQKSILQELQAFINKALDIQEEE
ncbi:CvpA family protein [Candidatus Persebacteraceae bacterium Df01]|jgi:membrane protein required for colicin V production|uniref:CvpA family protein n=1 Tax=Candidatus Doriopsillibacter californiensis TaxID=2970740 RepID=A0ABT7QLA6_9GAMM|nr:CvpA family protein [Candidatus Persebacteraceae bacterium Df01]